MSTCCLFSTTVSVGAGRLIRWGRCGDHRSLLLEVIPGREGGSRRGVTIGEELRRPGIRLFTRTEPRSLAGVGVQRVLNEIGQGLVRVETSRGQLCPQKHRGQYDQRNGHRPARQVDIKAVRAWANSNGIQLSQRGRIPADVISQYHAAGN